MTLSNLEKKFNPEEKLKELRSQDIDVIAQNDPYYPPQVLAISDPPICLYVKGNKQLPIHNLEYILAIVGTRKATSYGLTVTEHITRELVEYGFVIVSGMALGIDSQAHATALDTKGKTIAVLGCGVDIVYPPQNNKLYNRILEHNGTILSEFPPGQSVLPGLFVARNRIISALSKGVLVVEGSEKSGAMITARYAGEQGRDLYAIPGSITSSLSAGPHILIKNGAKVVTNIEDIIEDFGLTMKASQKDDVLKHLQGVEKKIAEQLLMESLSIDEMVVKLNISLRDIQSSVSMLELKGMIQKTQEGRYALT